MLSETIFLYEDGILHHFFLNHTYHLQIMYPASQNSNKKSTEGRNGSYYVQLLGFPSVLSLTATA